MTADQPIRILVIAGSLREASYNRRLARLAARRAGDRPGIEVVEYAHLGEVEPYDGDVEATGFPAGAARMAAAVRDSDAVFIATPEYNGSVPGQLKNALDWMSRADGATPEQGLPGSPMFGRPVAVASASTGQFGALWARDELVKALRTQGARPIAEPSVTIPHAADAFDEDGELRSDEQSTRLDGLLDTLATTTRAVLAARARIAAEATAAGAEA